MGSCLHTASRLELKIINFLIFFRSTATAVLESVQKNRKGWANGSTWPFLFNLHSLDYDGQYGISLKDHYRRLHMLLMVVMVMEQGHLFVFHVVMVLIILLLRIPKQSVGQSRWNRVKPPSRPNRHRPKSQGIDARLGLEHWSAELSLGTTCCWWTELELLAVLENERLVDAEAAGTTPRSVFSRLRLLDRCTL